MLADSLTSAGPFPRMFWALLLLAASLDAYQSWDNPECTEPEVTAPRGNRVEMACNVSNPLRDVTIELTAFGKTRAIFSQAPPGNNTNDLWQLRIQGGQAQLVITGAGDIHAGQYLWKLHGLQKSSQKFILNVPGEQDFTTTNQKTMSSQVTARHPPSVKPEVKVFIVVAIIIIVMGFGLFAWYEHRHSLKRHEVPGFCTSHGSPGSPYVTLP
ncbi:secreted and transmembrane protein 1b-like [Psammomys obesus]|uniref:secreted and transmembrane protein 1b-like n=1 Tax=Psammomys obesus TaxID=48139 RepID=UPI0024536808|nr:secreted and transmembrane protein 1b-like [Psammomys obesus]XP_055448041.1 secreted and transmembrane protein 1b-like [Psammomys obesus]